MKKTFVGVVAVVIAVTITACGNGSSSNVSNKAKSVGVSAIEITDGYLDNETDWQDANDQLQELLDDDLSYLDTEDSSSDTHSGDSSVEYEITMIAHDIFMDGTDGTAETYDDILSDRNDLADTIGEAKR